MTRAVRSIELPNQVRLHYFEQGSPAGIPLIMLPGLADSWLTFDLILPHLPESIHAYALSQRGHGDSSRPESGYHTGDFTADLRFFMDALQIEKAVILGASSGGFAARRFTLDHPTHVLGLVLLGSPATLQNNPQVQAIWDTTLSKLSDPVDPEFVRSFVTSVFSAPVPSGFIERMIQESLKVPARVWRDTTAGILEEGFPGELKAIQAPTLILWGGLDTVISRQDQEAVAATIPDSRLVIHPHAGHSLYWEEPGSVAADIAGFIRTLT